MPRYDYRCEAGHKYELTQPFGSPAVHPCQKCGKEARRLLVAPPLLFKAGGYYKTESRGGFTRSDRDDSSSDKPEKSEKKAKPKAEQGDKPAKAEKPAKADKPSKPAASAD
ncbi:MAG: zinc ribbon domain-containing protein [Chloroflexi bacterium]|nr:zinc ribbon domain-containing protein [Chloroflexota bacterium]